eukprot:4361279-Prymnesium_polylepis.1
MSYFSLTQLFSTRRGKQPPTQRGRQRGGAKNERERASRWSGGVEDELARARGGPRKQGGGV